MNQTARCPVCQVTLAESSLEGLCPSCLLKRGLEANTVPADTIEPVGEGKVPSQWTLPELSYIRELFPDLEIREFIGRGGMGAVYRARQKTLDREIALKILPQEIGKSPEFAERFTREARAMARLNHPHIVTIHEFGQREQLYYLMMEFVDGMNLRSLMESGHVASAEALAIVPQICEALQYAHQKDVVHCDIKPENILLNQQGQVKIADFGLARLVGRETIPSSERVMGTPKYMAPEQRLQPTEVDHRADIYAVGVVFYQMLTGELPQGSIEPPSRKVLIDVRLDAVVLRALEREPDRRYQQIGEIKTEVQSIVTSPAPVPPSNRINSGTFPGVSDWKRVGQWLRRSKPVTIALVLGVSLLAILAATNLVQSKPVEPELSDLLSGNPAQVNLAMVQLTAAPHKLSRLANEQLIQVALFRPISPWAWQELSHRTLSAKEIERICQGLLDWMKSNHPNGFTGHLDWLEGFLTVLNRQGVLPFAWKVEFLQAYHGILRSDAIRMRVGKREVQVQVDWRNPFELTAIGLAVVNEMKSVSIDGMPVSFPRQDNRHPHYFAEISLPDLAPGEHRLRFDVQSHVEAAESSNEPETKSAAVTRPVQASSWRRSVETRLMVYSNDEVLIKLADNPEWNPKETHGLEVQSTVAISGAQQEVVIEFAVNSSLRVPIAFDVSLIVGQAEIACGTMSAYIKNDKHVVITNNRKRIPVKASLAELKEAELILKPNVQLLESLPEIQQIWGQEIRYHGIPHSSKLEVQMADVPNSF